MILITSGFLAVGSAFGAVVLTTGLTSSGQVSQTLNDALARSGNGLELRGPVIAVTDGQQANAVSIEVGPAIGGDTGEDLDPAATLNRTIVSFMSKCVPPPVPTFPSGARCRTARSSTRSSTFVSTLVSVLRWCVTSRFDANSVFASPRDHARRRCRCSPRTITMSLYPRSRTICRCPWHGTFRAR
jgi:hypothetical protein